jgi:hypothetical protein
MDVSQLDEKPGKFSQ